MLRSILIKLHWLFSSQFGVDPRRFLRFLRGVPGYLHDWHLFSRGYSGMLTLMPCLHDRYEEGGTAKNEYFWQDLLVARWIFEAKPQRHVDIGSRVDGFVAHVASFREIEVFDVRPITAYVPGVVFKQADLMQPVAIRLNWEGYCDSLSCLHSLEHFGLGRYGDPVDPQGWMRGIENMACLIKPNGEYYLSTPIGQDRVEFNSHRVFNPYAIIRCAKENSLILQKLIVIASGGVVIESSLTEEYLQKLEQERYNLGIFVFKKINR